MSAFFHKLSVWFSAMRSPLWFKGFWVIFALFGQTKISYADLLTTGLALIIVSFLSGAIYINNDIHDIESDRSHPTKKFRPFALGQLTVEEGKLGLMVLTLLIGLLLFVLNNIVVTYLVFLMVLGNILYTQQVKLVPYVELIYYGFLTAIRYWIGVSAINAHFLLLPSIFTVSLGVCMLALLRFMEKSRYGNSGRVVLKTYSLKWLKIIMILTGVVCALSAIIYGISIATWLVVPSLGLAFYLARLIYLSMQKVEQPEEVDDIDKMLKNDTWLKILIVPYFLSVAVEIVTSIAW